MLERRILAATIAAVVGLGGVAPVALAGGDRGTTRPAPTVTHKKKAKKAKKLRCNAGRGNGSEVVVNDGHCLNGDPGNSWSAGNQGGG